MRTARILGLVALAAALVTTAACGKKDEKTPPGLKVTVSATDTECKLDRTDLQAGVNEFVVTNNGSKITEFYVYEGSTIKGEVENIGPGVTRSVRVELKAGTYEGACKPGMTGDGIRVPLTVG
jgi:iron uptake system component EfeO